MLSLQVGRVGRVILMIVCVINGATVLLADQEQQDAQQPPFKLDAGLIEQACQAAAVALAMPRDLKKRRPEGITDADLNSPQAIQRVIARAMPDVASKDSKQSGLALQQLSYLGDHAFEALVAGAKSDDFAMAYRCGDLLKRRGTKGVAPLCAVLKSKSWQHSGMAARYLGEMQDPAAVPALIEVLNEAREISNLNQVASALMFIKDQRAIEPLRKFGKQFENELRTLETPENFRPWPPEQLPVRQLGCDVRTFAGESFGAQEVARLAAVVDSNVPQVRWEATEALILLNDPSVIPRAIQSKNYRLLAHIPTPEAFEFLADALKTPEKSVRQQAAIAVGHAGRWGVPLLIGMLDDSAQMEANIVSSEKYAERVERTSMPDEHFIHRLLYDDLGMLGLRGRRIDVRKSTERVSVIDDMARAKAWWAQHGDDFLDGKDLPNPNLTRHYASSISR